eukprot:gnl/Spiro4/16816_TR9050_c0_g2_i1.p1 gnl/Spiro4/16816_TR9050_c0_g2~~gnl/Spiro4/16816_TR9050_c0_g2_i1.p1  ORF type:complete len:145 (-),score=34.31 gnl/Spiro4/16816_TR9050_c0_g2_i1:76-474(-)
MSVRGYAIVALSVLLSLVFCCAGLCKLTSLFGEEALDLMKKGSVEYSKFLFNILPPDVFRVLIGVSEVLGAIALHIKPLNVFSNIGLLMTMAGAVSFHVGMADGKFPVPAVLAGLLAARLVLVLSAPKPKGH